MSKGNTTETNVLAKIFNNTAISWDAATNLEVHLHTADPGEAGVTTTSETAYGGYSASGVSVSRNAGGWTVSGNSASNTALIQFPTCVSGTSTLTHVSISPAGSTQILYKGALSATLSVSAGIQPQFAVSALTITED